MNYAYLNEAGYLLMKAEVKNHTFKIPTKLYRIGELVHYTPFSRQTIHNYTTIGLIRETQWTEGGHRLYDESVFERLSRITTSPLFKFGSKNFST